MARTNTVSAGSGPAAPSSSAAGRSTRSSSSPNSPDSPACGLTAHTARRGRSIPHHSRRARCTVRPVRTTRSVVSKRRHIPEGHVGRDQHNPERDDLPARRQRLRGQHHGHVHVAGEMRQPFGMTWIGESCEVKRVFVGRRGDDGVDLAAERQLDRGLDRVPGDAARADHAASVQIFLAASEPPGSHGELPLCRDADDLVFSTDQSDLGIERLGQRARR